ncbi:MAG: methyltransferase domain-containing protein, partial [Armatimonadetes bacterium]|nr:methyltransferase domain-containing protein [Armatimonadota bacterium]
MAANVLDQFSRVNVWSVLYQLFARDEHSVYLDYGCGTASVSFAFLNRCDVAVLLDVPNDSQAFVRWRVERAGLQQVAVMTPDDAPGLPDGGFSLVACIDVLEHLPDPSAAFAGLQRVLRPGGLLLLRAPWARDDEDFGEHLPEATDNWHAPGGGAAQLLAGFERLAEIAD